MDSMIQINNLKKTYSNGFNALKGINVNIEKGKRCLFQVGTAFFDHGNKRKIEEVPDVFFKSKVN